MDDINAEITSYNNLLKVYKDILADVESTIVKLRNEKLILAKKDYEDKMKKRNEEVQQLYELKAVEEEKLKILFEQIEELKRTINFYQHQDSISDINIKINALVKKQMSNYEACNCDIEYNIINAKSVECGITTCGICGHIQYEYGFDYY
jgi:hypothetical protein